MTQQEINELNFYINLEPQYRGGKSLEHILKQLTKAGHKWALEFVNGKFELHNVN